MAPFNNSSSPPAQLFPSSQFSVLDLFIPGSTGILATIEQVLASNSYARVLCILILLVFLGRHAQRYIEEWTTYFTSTIYAPYSDEVYDMVTAWASTQPFANTACSSIAKISTRWGTRFADDLDTREKKPLHYSPWNTSCIFWFKGRLVMYRCYQKETGFYRPEEVSVSCIPGSQDHLRDLFAECRATYLHLIRNKTSIFEHQDGDWEATKTKGTRPISTVIMNEKNKHALLKDVQEFLDEGAREWYSRRGIPYRKGFLFYGPPRTGKSSFSFSLAGHFDLDIYVLSLVGVTDSGLAKLFKRLPQRCAVLLEDIDAADMSRSRDTPAKDAAQVTGDSTEKTRPQGALSLSGLLNAIDRVLSHEGRVLIMTTNHTECLDPRSYELAAWIEKLSSPMRTET